MALVTASETEAAAEQEAPRATFHVLPPPPPRPRTWTRELGIALGLGLLINLLVLLPLLFVGPKQTPPADEPHAIEVEIIQEPQPEPEPEPQPQPEIRTPFRFGADEAPDETGDTDRVAREPPRPLEDTPERTAQPERSEAPPDLPVWAQTIERSYSASSPDRGRTVGRGDEYGRMLRQRLNANLVLPPDLDRARIVPPHANVSFDRSGRLVNLVLLRSSGSPALDRAMLDAIRRSFPVPPIPAHISDNVVTLPLTLDFQ